MVVRVDTQRQINYRDGDALHDLFSVPSDVDWRLIRNSGPVLRNKADG